LKLEKDCFADFANLDELSLEKKGLEKIEPEPCLLLKKLSLESNQINRIEFNSFWGLENLEELNLCHNKLTRIESNSFRHLSKLKVLDLTINPIYEIESNGFQGLDNLEEF
jgi:Leucine-rich repeat (LRR) protein